MQPRSLATTHGGKGVTFRRCRPPSSNHQHTWDKSRSKVCMRHNGAPQVNASSSAHQAAPSRTVRPSRTIDRPLKTLPQRSSTNLYTSIANLYASIADKPLHTPFQRSSTNLYASMATMDPARHSVTPTGGLATLGGPFGHRPQSPLVGALGPEPDKGGSKRSHADTVTQVARHPASAGTPSC
ncbi:hypothetical protein BD413DRAFT_561217 [Trametes elegans]|nr:hypothetical protein BD413DRAFT_561217 [Trametes elegans]